jgi:hypothetical protein
VFSFAAKLIKGKDVGFSIRNSSPYTPSIVINHTMQISSDWNNYEIEFTAGSAASATCVLGMSSTALPPFQGGDGIIVVFDDIKLIAKDHTMEFGCLDVNNIRACYHPIIPFLSNDNAHPYFEVPKNSGKSTIYSTNLWLGGYDQPNNQGNLHLAAQRFCQEGQDFWLGPITNDLSGQVVSDAYIQKYHHTWIVSKTEINYHRAHYKDPGYVMPWAIANWPAHGRTQFGESPNIAPFVNVAGNSSYEPEKGDYPLIRGDQAIFFITNDMEGPHTESHGGLSLGVEILGMAYAYNKPDSALQNTIFLSYELHNKSANTYHDFYFGYFINYAIGYAFDDYVGCDTLRNLSYVYNGNEIDGSGQPWAYGENPPVQGCMFLNQKMNSFNYFNNMNGPMGDPNYTLEYYNYMRAKWRDGIHFTYGGAGYNPESSDFTNYIFSGDPVAGTGWRERTPNGPGSTPNPPADRRGMMSAGPFTFAAGETITIDIALPFARDYGSKSALSSLALLGNFADEIQEYYDEYIVGIKENPSVINKLRVYPNPSNGQFTVSGEKIIEIIEVYDIMGKKVFASSPKEQTFQINTGLPQGFYIYRETMEDHSIGSGKIVVQ